MNPDLDVAAKDGEAALAAAWAAYKPDAKWPLKVANDVPDKDGWSKQRVYQYQTSPNERRSVVAAVRWAGGAYAVVIYDMADPVGEKRGGQVALVFDRFLPKGYARETFLGKKANRLAPSTEPPGGSSLASERSPGTGSADCLISILASAGVFERLVAL